MFFVFRFATRCLLCSFPWRPMFESFNFTGNKVQLLLLYGDSWPADGLGYTLSTLPATRQWRVRATMPVRLRQNSQRRRYNSSKTNTVGNEIFRTEFHLFLTGQISTSALRIPIFAQTELARTCWAHTVAFAIPATKWTALGRRARTSTSVPSTTSFVTEDNAVTHLAVSKYGCPNLARNVDRISFKIRQPRF